MSFFYAGRTLERQFITAEINQRKEEGCDVAEISPRISAALELSLIHISEPTRR